MTASFAVGGLLALSFLVDGTAQAQSRCDAGVTKALARKVSCKLKVLAAAQKTGAPVDTARLTRCESRFAGQCTEAQGKGDCQVHTSSCDALEAAADQCVGVLGGTSTTTTTTSSTTTTTLDPLTPCGPLGDGTCGGICPFPFDSCVEGSASGECVCVEGPCGARGGIGQCGGTCPDPRAVCGFGPTGCLCAIPCAGSGAPPCNPPCGAFEACLFNPSTSACECVGAP
jgi:hypothetical protein